MGRFTKKNYSSQGGEVNLKRAKNRAAKNDMDRAIDESEVLA